MSRIGKQIIEIPDGVEVKLDKNILIVRGPKGELKRKINKKIKLDINQDIKVSSQDSALWGLYRSLINNMVIGVAKGFEKKLEIVGIGYKGEIKNNKLIMGLGYSHPVEMSIPKELEVKIDKNIISVSGIDNQLVGQFAANTKKQRKPDAYKGKGIRYLGEEIKLKPGKKAMGAES